MLSGIAGLGHMFVGAGFVLLLLALFSRVRTER
jgi:hypothetical protein